MLQYQKEHKSISTLIKEEYGENKFLEVIQEECEANKEMLKKKIQTFYKLLSSSMVLIIRISNQLGESDNVTQTNVINRLSGLGLRLEHMI